MTAGYAYMLVGLLSFAGMGIVHKLGDRYACDPLAIALVTMATSCFLSLAYAGIAHPDSLTSWNSLIPWVALPFGAAAGAGLWLFQKGLRFGHIATSWLLVNLSSGVPTVLSLIVYHERLNQKKLAILVLITISLVLLWWDQKRRGNMLEGPH